MHKFQPRAAVKAVATLIGLVALIVAIAAYPVVGGALLVLSFLSFMNAFLYKYCYRKD